MSLIRKPRSPFWWYDFTYQGKRYRASTGQKSKTAATVEEAAVLTKLSEGCIPHKSARTPTLREFSVRFLMWSENSIALTPASKKFYVYGVRLLLFTRLADTPLNQLNSELIECACFVDSKGKPCSPAYTNQALRTLRALTGKAVDWEVLRSRPSFAMAKTQGRDRLIDNSTEIALQEQFEAPTTNGKRNKMREQAWMVMVILQDTGMRPDEVFPMRIEDVRWSENRIWVPKGKTANARRFVGMSDRMRTMLIDWCQGRAEGWVFPSSRAKSGHLGSIAKGFQQARKRAGIDSKVVPYSARHTYATHQMQATGNTFAVSRSMGHAGVKSMEPYQHPDTSALNTTINARNRVTAMQRIDSFKGQTEMTQ